MPWTETSPVDQRQRFIADVRAGLYSMTELCARYGISRTAGYKWVARADEGGRQALADRSRAPLHCPHRIPTALADLLCATRRAHPLWGPKKVLQYLGPRHRRIAHWPAVSTVGDLLVREGLVTKRRRRRRAVHPGTVSPPTTEPNDLWAADFTGQFRTGDGIYCYPLTITDQHSRFLLTCHSLRNVQTVGARPAFERAFREYGLPRAIRTDNGVPFATQAVHGLSQLNVWWIRLGIQHQRILPAHPQQNGAHERMHKTLKAEAIRPPRATLPAQQRAFDAFRREYNTVRPHDTSGAEHQPRCTSPHRARTLGVYHRSSIPGTTWSSGSPAVAPSVSGVGYCFWRRRSRVTTWDWMRSKTASGRSTSVKS